MAGIAHPMLHRFWKRVDVRGPDECWPWLAGTTEKGYGVFWPRKGRPEGAHRVAWELSSTEPIPDGLDVMHSCDNPPCCNPAHLKPGTSSENHWDASSKGRIPGNRTSRGGPAPKHELAIYVALRKRGLTLKQIGDELGVAPATALRNLRKAA